LPLPEHGRPAYTSSTSIPALEQDPVFRRHSEDWRTFHTRFVEASAYLAGLAFDRAGAP
jgi:hypothetical protein